MSRKLVGAPGRGVRRAVVHLLQRSLAVACGLGISALAAAPAWALDHDYRAWDQLLKGHVAWNSSGVASTVDYSRLAADRPALTGILAGFSTVGAAEFARFSRAQRLAFLINAYNAYTLELVLTRYPNLSSIKDLGSLFQSPWKRRFFRLLGKETSLDDIEHGMIRQPGAFDEPRIHFVLVCASIGCPALRPEAIVAARLDDQLEDSVRRFLSDHSRNRVDAASGRLQLSKIFDWYRGDFERNGSATLAAFIGSRADRLTSDPSLAARIRGGKLEIEFLDYDWRLNDRPR